MTYVIWINVREGFYDLKLARSSFPCAGEFLKLDKWLNDKIRDHGEMFITALVKFVQQRCPMMASPPLLDDASSSSSPPNPPLPLSKASQLPHDTLATITQCLTPYSR